MKSKIAIVMMVAFLVVGCSSTPKMPEPTVVTKIERVPVKIPDELFKKPEPVKDINPLTGTQKDVSRWVTEMYDRMVALELIIDSIKTHNDESAKKISEDSDK